MVAGSTLRPQFQSLIGTLAAYFSYKNPFTVDAKFQSLIGTLAAVVEEIMDYVAGFTFQSLIGTLAAAPTRSGHLVHQASFNPS